MPARSLIAEGFRGQHLVVLPATVRRRVEKHPLLRGLLVTDAGVFPRAEGHLVERPRGAATTLLIFCTAGHGWAQIGGQRSEIGAGALAWLPARQPHAYGTAENATWTIEWAHFSGEEADSWRELLQLPVGGGVIQLGETIAPELKLARVWEQLERGYSLANLSAASVELRTALSSVCRLRNRGGGSRSASERVAASAEWMKEHLGQSVRLEELAALAGVSAPHYSALFRRLTGFAPIDWFIRLRIQRACQLLDTTEETVAEIGRRVGFPDPYYFTRCFRRVMGAPPREYRRVQKG